jgi:hypothetical protein
MVSVINCDYSGKIGILEEILVLISSQNVSKFSFQSHLELKSFSHMHIAFTSCYWLVLLSIGEFGNYFCNFLRKFSDLPI